MFPYKIFFQQNRNWFIIALLIFLTGVLVCFWPVTAVTGRFISLDQLLGSQMEGLEDLMDGLNSMPPAMLALAVFFNNLVSVAQMLLLGFLAGLSPLFTLFINGALIGSVAGSIVQEGQSLSAFILLGIFPHGIFELPAFFICGALGLKFGYHCLASPLPGLSRKQSFFYIWRETFHLLPLIITLLAVGAAVEIYISRALLLKYLAL